MSTADYLRGFEEGVRAMAKGPFLGALESLHALDRLWMRHKGLLLVPGETTLRSRTYEEWCIYRDELMQRATGHNLLVKEPG